MSRISEQVAEIVREAIDLEANAKIFYELAATVTEHERGKAMFERLAREESGHMDEVGEIITALTGGEDWREAVDEDSHTVRPSAIVESCASRIFLPNPQATEPQIRTIYEGFGLSRRQIDIVAEAVPKRDYYYQSRLGNRLFDLDLGPVTLAFAGASTPQDQRAIDEIRDAVSRSVPSPDFAAAWLRHRGLDWAADLVPSFPSLSSSPQENAP